MITTAIAFILAVTVCLIATSWKNDMLDSVSEVAYIIPHWAFTIWIALVGGLLMPDIMEHLPENWQWVGFLCVVGLFCVGASSYYRTQERTLHYVGGFLWGVCATVVVILNCWPLLLGWILYVVLMWLSRWRCYTFWSEYVITAQLCTALMCF